MCQRQVDESGYEVYAKTGVCPTCAAAKDLERVRKERLVTKGLIEKRMNEAIPPLFRAARVIDFGATQARALSECDGLATFLWGPTGVGKSHAACAMIRRAIARTTGAITVARVHYELLCMEVRASFGPAATKTEWDVVGKYITPDLLVIEDVGSGKSIGKAESDHSVKTLLVILDSRMEERQQTIITSNKSWETLRDSFDERVASRLLLFRIVGFKGKDRRLK